STAAIPLRGRADGAGVAARPEDAARGSTASSIGTSTELSVAGVGDVRATGPSGAGSEVDCFSVGSPAGGGRELCRKTTAPRRRWARIVALSAAGCGCGVVTRASVGAACAAGGGVGVGGRGGSGDGKGFGVPIRAAAGSGGAIRLGG